MMRLAELLHGRRAGDLLVESLPALRRGSRRLVRCTLLDVSPRAEWTAQFEAGLENAAGSVETHHFTIQRQLNGNLERAEARIQSEAGRAIGRCPELGELFAARADLGLIVYPFPLDPRIKRLVKAADPQRAARQLNALIGAGARECRVRMLRYVPARRCQMLFEFTGVGGGSGSVLGKLFRDERGEVLYRAMEQVAGWFRAAGGERLATPGPLAYCPDWQMVVQERAPGRTLHELLARGEAEERHVQEAARCLRLLHRGPFAPRETYSIEDELALIENSLAGLEEAGIAAPEFPAVLERIARRGRGLAAPDLVPVHRDFYDKQLLIDGWRTALIDFDTLALGPAEIDAANFVAHLELRAIQGMLDSAAAQRLAGVFIEAYRPARSDLFDFFTATTFFRLASKQRLRSGGCDSAGLDLLARANGAVL